MIRKFPAQSSQSAQRMSIHDGKYVTWIAGDDAATVETFAKLALKYAKEKGCQMTGTEDINIERLNVLR